MTAPQSSPEGSLQPKLANQVHHRHEVAQRLTVFYIASLSAIAGLSMAGQFFIQQALNRQLLDVEMIQATLEHKEQVGRTIHGLRALRRISDQTDRQEAITEVATDLDSVEDSWDELVEMVERSSSSSDPKMGMVNHLKPAYREARDQLTTTLEKALKRPPKIGQRRERVS